MAPTDRDTLERQTSDIIRCLLEDEHVLSCRGLDASVEIDSADPCFDPVLIADKLRDVADSLNDDVTFRAALNDLKRAAAQEAAEAAFSHGVEALCKTRVSQGAEVAQEMQLIRASVDFGLYIKKSYPELKNKVQSAMTSFLNRRVGTWVAEQGGWDRVAGVSD
ncbi:putative bcl-2-like protein 15 [Scophthalmus maximus]|uniref:Putative bcl-2-like protein 15 n=1 Tax=Scophthalmus maximus TaxID=52904 RepID=A0A2U9BH77_SCOMX|nr:putative bcl-2-like protein 15 [Scophthalmus maximus]